jgi:hypothetical protein
MGNSEVSIPADIMPMHQPVSRPYRVKERRLQKRNISSRFKLTCLGVEHPPVNWSLGGILVAGRHPRTDVGTIIEAFLDILAHPRRFAIRLEPAHAVRCAAKIRSSMAGPDADVPEDRCIKFREASMSATSSSRSTRIGTGRDATLHAERAR